jgi:glutaminyl-tRNA synthetase
MSWLEGALREDLNRRAERRMAVLRPLKVVIENFPEGHVEELEAINNPEDPSAGSRTVRFTRELYIESSDFMEDPPKKFFRLGPGREVRLRYGYFLRCNEIVKDPESGEVIELRCTYDPETLGGKAPDGRKVKGTIHWVSAEHSHGAEVRLYDHLFSVPDAGDVPEGGDYRDNLNPESLVTLTDCRIEQSLESAQPGQRYQFERTGYFSVDADSSAEKLVFNRTVTLRDTWAKIQKKGSQGKKK